MKRVAERPRIERRRRVGRAHSCSPPSGAATSTCTTSATASGSPAQVAAGVELLRRIYDLRHTFATFALRAGISTFDLSRYMGASLTMMIDRHYGHLADRLEVSSLSTDHGDLLAFYRSPLTDSNRRPPPYHGLRSATRRNPRQRSWPDFAVFAAVALAAGCQRLRPLGSINAPSLEGLVASSLSG
jgi:hypothetical protein